MAEAYCVKDKMKVEVVNPQQDHDEERQAGAPGHVPEVRRQGLQDRRLTADSNSIRARPSPATAGAVRFRHGATVAQAATHRNASSAMGRDGRPRATTYVAASRHAVASRAPAARPTSNDR